MVERHGRSIAGIVPAGIAESLLREGGLVPIARIESELRRAAKIKGVQKLVLFGSYARGDAHARSDIDVMLVIDEGYAWMNVYRKVSALLARTRIKFEIIPVESITWEKVDWGVIGSAKREGRVL